MARCHRLLVGAGLATQAPVASAHSFGTIYNLPVPFTMYAYGAAAALLVSFVVVGYFVGARNIDLAVQARETALTRRLLGLMDRSRALDVAASCSVLLLFFTILTGLVGTRDPYANFNMTFFWVVFSLGFTYFTAFVGGLYDRISPWRTLCRVIEAAWPGAFEARLRYPEWLESYPAVALYMAFIWMELFGRTQPGSLSIALIVYTAITLAGCAAFGKEAWLARAELFAVFMDIVSRIAPLALERRPRGAMRLVVRRPFMGLAEDRGVDLSMLVFILFMLSSTAFDGIRETVAWTQLFWKHFYPHLELLAKGVPQPYLFLVQFFYYWQWACLLLSPFAYLAVYLLFIAMAKWITRSELGVRELAFRFAFTLVPIAFVYNVTHYYTLLVSQGSAAFHLISDPFGRGSDYFGTADWFRTPPILDAGAVWHTQVWLIVAGHIISVYLAHLEALRVFRSPRQAVLSQVPLLFLMVLLTTLGLWILSLPIGPAVPAARIS